MKLERITAPMPMRDRSFVNVLLAGIVVGLIGALSGGALIQGCRGSYHAMGTFHTEDLVVDDTASIGGQVQIGSVTPSAGEVALVTEATAATTSMMVLQPTVTNHVGTGGNNELINVVVRNSTTFDTTANAGHASGIDIVVDGSISAGANALENIGIAIAGHHTQANVSNYAIKSTDTVSIFEHDGPTTLGGPSGTSVVQLGNQVKRFTVLDESPSTITPQLDVGVVHAVDGYNMHIQNTATGVSAMGIALLGDTTVTASVAPQLVLGRGAGGALTKFGLLCNDNGAASCLAGAAANDIVLANYGAGNTTWIAQATGSVVVGTTAGGATATFDSAHGTTLTGTLSVMALSTLTGGFTLGADSSANSHKITNLANGTAAQDAVAFGQLTGLSAPFFGDGFDGSLHYDGSTTILGMAPVANVYTLTRDIYPTDMTVDNGVTIKAANWRIFGNGTLTNNGTIHNNGNSASGSVAGAATAAGFYIATIAGGNGVTGSGGGSLGTASGATLPNPRWSTQATVTGGTNVGGNGNNGNGTGQAGSGGGASTTAAGACNAGGSGGSLTASNSNFGAGINELLSGRSVAASTQFTVGSSGGGGAGCIVGGTGTNPVSGGGGAGGGWLYIGFRKIAGTGTISCNGGTGADAVAGSGNSAAGGGAGGGGGVLVLVYNTQSGQTETASGGAGGAKAQGGTFVGGNGGSGIAGSVIKFNLSGDGT